MQKILFSFVILFFLGLSIPMGGGPGLSPSTDDSDSLSSLVSIDEPRLLYELLELDELVRYEAFQAAYAGYKQLNRNNNPLLTVIDFNLPSTEKRMYVLDLAAKKVLFVSHVAHGRNSGGNYATSFSNRNGSYQSSLGFYRTASTYQGGNGYSLVLDGLEKGINDNARPRAIVIHGADYRNENIIKSTGRLGRSFGCPALPRELNKPIIDAIKGGSILFIYADQPEYLAHSEVLQENSSTGLVKGNHRA